MAFTELLKGKVRAALAGILTAGQESELGLNRHGDLLVAQAFPSLAELVREGDSWHCQAASAAASVVAIPTTAALFALYNGEDDGGKSYIVDRVFWTQISAGAAVYQAAIIGMVNHARLATAPTDGGLTKIGLACQAAYGGRSRIHVAVTAPANNGWFGLGPAVSSPVSAGSLPGLQIDFALPAPIIIKPGRQLNLSVLGSHTTVTGLLGVQWHEVRIEHGAS